MLLSEDDMVPCRGALPGIAQALARFRGRRGAGSGTNWMLRTGGGLAGVVLPLAALPSLHDFVSRHYLLRPVDH